eukprot:gnl/MRDRNA2_/MRDRNA2_309247_c0_seq1.p1 gnl/MRDRNA2_/MRDRNA2_309247_c0~~gnl/MRDRNA2_/MRDRNA2_309247_c0_seq1.p1  ORF type:complete len:106 (+),score=1.82 gnl/MRDRNA2_/MRDRNA2_309247_c0_seq1:56-373(+)
MHSVLLFRRSGTEKRHRDARTTRGTQFWNSMGVIIVPLVVEVHCTTTMHIPVNFASCAALTALLILRDFVNNCLAKNLATRPHGITNCARGLFEGARAIVTYFLP